MATHSSVLAWRIPGSAEPGVPSMDDIISNLNSTLSSKHLENYLNF